MPATKKRKLEKAASGTQNLLTMFGGTPRAARRSILPTDEAYNRDYAKWGDEKSAWQPDDIPKAHKKDSTSLKDFLTVQGAVRGFSSHQNWPQGKKIWMWRHFDTIATQDAEMQFTWFQLTKRTQEAYEKHTEKLKEDAKKKKEEDEAAAARMIEDARERARADAARENEQVQLAPTTQEEGFVPIFSVVDDQKAPRLDDPSDAYLHEISRAVLREIREEEAEEQAVLSAIVSQRKKKRTEKGRRTYERGIFAGDPPFEGLLQYEVERFVREKVRPTEEPSSHFPSFPTPFERSVIPPDVLSGVYAEKLEKCLEKNYWLQPTSTGLICRACFGRVKCKKTLTFVNSVLPWSGLKYLDRKIGRHTRSAGRKHTTKTHQDWHVIFTEEVSQLYRSPTPVASTPGLDVKDRILNTQHLVRLFQILGTTLAATKPLDDCNFLLHLMSTLDRSIREFLRQNKNLTSATVRDELVDCLYYRLKLRVVRKIKQSRFLSLLADEVEDVKKRSHIGVIFKLYCSVAPEEVFWDIQKLVCAHTGKNMACVVVKMVQPLNCWDGVCATSTDGASSMAGEHEGARSFWRKYCCPFAVWVWCEGHSLNLACLDAANDGPQEISVGFSAVKEVYLLFWSGHGGNVAHKALVLQECKQMVDIADNFFSYRSDLVLGRVGDTRWLSHERCAKTLTLSLKICLHAIDKLAGEGNEDACSLRRKFSITTCFSIFLLASVSSTLSVLSRCLQRADLCWLECSTFKTNAIKDLETLRDTPSSDPLYYGSHAVISDSRPPTWWDGFGPDQAMFLQFHERMGKAYLNKLIESIDIRLGNLPILEGLAVYDPRSTTFKALFEGVDVHLGNPSAVAAQIMPKAEFTLLKDKMTPFFEHFNTSKEKFVSPDLPNCSHSNAPYLDDNVKSQVLNELPRALVEMARITLPPSKASKATFTDYAVAFLEAHKNGKMSSFYDATVLLLQLALVLPLGTASVERTFSRLRLLFHYTRGRLKQAKWQKLLFIALNMPADGIDDTLMAELVHDFCVNNLSPSVGTDVDSDMDEGEAENPDINPEAEGDEADASDPEAESEVDMSDLVYLDSKRKLKFAKYELWKEARSTIQAWRHSFSEKPDLFLTPKQAEEALSALRQVKE